MIQLEKNFGGGYINIIIYRQVRNTVISEKFQGGVQPLNLSPGSASGITLYNL